MKLAYTYTYKRPSIMHVYIAYLYILYIYTLYLSSKDCDPCTWLIIYIFQLNLFRNFWHDTEFFMPILHLSNKFVKMTSIFARTLCIHIIAMIVLSCVVKKLGQMFTVYENRDRIMHSGQTASLLTIAECLIFSSSFPRGWL